MGLFMPPAAIAKRAVAPWTKMLPMIDRENWSETDLRSSFPVLVVICTRVILLPRFGESRTRRYDGRRRQWRNGPRPFVSRANCRARDNEGDKRHVVAHFCGPDRRQCHFHMSFTFCQIATFTVYAAELTFWRGTMKLLSLLAAASSRRGTEGVSAASERSAIYKEVLNLFKRNIRISFQLCGLSSTYFRNTSK